MSMMFLTKPPRWRRRDHPYSLAYKLCLLIGSLWTLWLLYAPVEYPHNNRIIQGQSILYQIYHLTSETSRTPLSPLGLWSYAEGVLFDQQPAVVIGNPLVGTAQPSNVSMELTNLPKGSPPAAAAPPYLLHAQEQQQIAQEQLFAGYLQQLSTASSNSSFLPQPIQQQQPLQQQQQPPQQFTGNQLVGTAQSSHNRQQQPPQQQLPQQLLQQQPPRPQQLTDQHVPQVIADGGPQIQAVESPNTLIMLPQSPDQEAADSTDHLQAYTTVKSWGPWDTWACDHLRNEGYNRPDKAHDPRAQFLKKLEARHQSIECNLINIDLEFPFLVRAIIIIIIIIIIYFHSWWCLLLYKHIIIYVYILLYVTLLLCLQ
eukprot:GHVQ01040373.1.p1 GENE.GHVQ01040373.1~~GHVQ01040373.1.p1  ORF type:complete len:370 (+),score=61.95 GHVQ01040373.1:222-1331(+)